MRSADKVSRRRNWRHALDTVATLAVCAFRVWMVYPDWRWAVTAVVVVVLLAKAAVAGWMARGLLRERLARPATVAASLVGWLALSGIVAWLVCHFTGEGASAGPEPFEDPRVVKLCADAFEAVWERATPHEEYKPA